MSDKDNQIVKRLLNPACYPHQVSQVKLIETHISWIFLAGEFAYKMKKPVAFGFLDFSTLEARHFYCQEELRLNRRCAPQLYLEVCSIGGDPDHAEFGASPTHDYLVKMIRFPYSNQLDQLLAHGHLTVPQITATAKALATFHRHTDAAPSRSQFGSPKEVINPVLDNFMQLRKVLPDHSCVAQVNDLEHWSRLASAAYTKRFEQRKEDGFIRECHGDLHLANMVWWQEQPLFFDCIEFNPHLRWIDVLSEVAFLVMDLDDRGASALGWRLLNAYLQWTGDYRDLDLLTFYKVYRAMVRSKVISLRLSQPGLPEAERVKSLELMHSYLTLADRYTQPRKGTLVISHGLSASGKTSFINNLASHYGAISIHSDVERKRIAGLAPTELSHSGPDMGIYTHKHTEATYRSLLHLAESILRAGLPVLVDATFLRQSDRNQFRQLAEALDIPFVILDFQQSEEELRQRIRRRLTLADQTSEANEQVLDKQLLAQEPLTHEEGSFSYRIGPNTNLEELAAKLSDSTFI